MNGSTHHFLFCRPLKNKPHHGKGEVQICSTKGDTRKKIWGKDAIRRRRMSPRMMFRRILSLVVVFVGIFSKLKGSMSMVLLPIPSTNVQRGF